MPVLFRTKYHEHVGFSDPSAAEGKREEKLAAFRTAREDITRSVRTRFESV